MLERRRFCPVKAYWAGINTPGRRILFEQAAGKDRTKAIFKVSYGSRWPAAKTLSPQTFTERKNILDRIVMNEGRSNMGYPDTF
jgi:hypothetical protein